MLYAKKNRAFRHLFYLYQQTYLFPRHFYSVCVRGQIDPPGQEPTLYIANHSSWWDGLILFQLTEKLSSRQHYIMMDEEQLTNYSFFRKLGAFSVDKKKPRSLLQSLHYAEGLLKEGKSVWLFPQGAIQPLEKRPFMFQSGARFLLQQVTNAIVKPATFYYAFDAEQKPTVSIMFGDAVKKNWQEMGKKAITQELEAVLHDQLETHKALINQSINYKEAFFSEVGKRGRSTSDRFDRLKKGLGG